MIAATADRAGGLEPPDGSSPLDALRRELAPLDWYGQYEVLTVLAIKATCSVVAGALAAALRHGDPLAVHLYGIDDKVEDDGMTNEMRPNKMETRHQAGFDEQCVGGGWPGAPACTRRPVVAVDGREHRCAECFRTWAGPHKFKR